MPLDVDATYAPELLIYRLDDWPTLEEQTAVRERLVADRTLMPHTPALIDFRQVTELPDADDAAAAIVGTIQRGAGPRRSAFVVGTPEQEAFVNALSAVAARSLDVRAFRQEREALNWLFPSNRFPLSFLGQ